MSDILTRAFNHRWAFRASAKAAARQTTDQKMMARCLELAKTAAPAGEFPFAAVITKNGEVVAETLNRVARDNDITRHAELIAVSEAQKRLGRGNLRNCTLYTIIEPCPMCSFAIREAGVSRVVFALTSPLMGGSSRLNVLGDDVLSLHMPETFAPPPDVVAGLLSREAAQVWRRWNPIVWGIIRLRGVFRPKPVQPPQPPALDPACVATAPTPVVREERAAPVVREERAAPVELPTASLERRPVVRTPG
jgi:tRNA(adenine34) deaminase